MSSKTDRTALWIMVGLALLALAVRIPGLNGGLWNDEISSLLFSYRTPFPAMLTEYPGDNKHPLYSHLAHLAIVTFGEANWTIRLPALLFGVATVPMLYVFGRQVVREREAVLSAALLALSYHHVWFSQSARGYIVLAFAMVVTTHLLLKVLRNGSTSAAVLYALAIALGVYTHLTFVFAVFAQFGVALLALALPARSRSRPDWRTTLLPFAAGGILTLALYAPMLQQIREYFRVPSEMAQSSDATWAIGEAIRVLRSGLGDQFGVGLLVLGVCAAIGLAGVVSLLKRDRDVALLLTLPAVTVTLGALATSGALYPRFYFLLAGFLVLIAVRGAFASAGWVMRVTSAKAAAPAETAVRRGDALAMGCVVLLLVASTASLPRNWNVPKQDFEGAMHFVETEAQPGDLITTTDITTEMYRRYYRQDWRAVRNAPELEALRDSVTGKVWMIYTFPRYLALFDSALEAKVDRECHTERVFPATLGGGEVVVCSLPGGGAR